MPTFCRHNRFLQNCPICSREQEDRLRPILTPGGGSSGSPARPRGQARAPRRPDVQIRHLARGADDGYHSQLLPGLRSSADASRLAEELAFAAARLDRLRQDPPGLYAEAAAATDPEEATWLTFLIAYLGPLDGDDPFAAIRSARVTWASGELPALDAVETGPRGAHAPGRGARTVEAYRQWAARAGSQAAAFTGEPAWTPERRFARAYERLALPGLHRDARFELLVSLGSLGIYELRAGSLMLGADNDVTLAAKRALGIGDPLLLDRRASELARACQLPLEALDTAFYNWERGERHMLGVAVEPDESVIGRATTALGV